METTKLPIQQMPQWMKENNQFICCGKKDCCKKYKKKGNHCKKCPKL